MDSNFHIKNWIEDILNSLFPIKLLSIFPTKIEKYIWDLFQKILIFFRIISPKNNIDLSSIPIRTATFIREARKHGISFEVFSSPFGYINYFRMKINGKIFSFEGLPRAEFLSKPKARIIDDKALVKYDLKKYGFPVINGKSFYFFQKKKAVRWTLDNLGFPVVVKPRNGSLSQFVFTDIQDNHSLESKIEEVCYFSPLFLIEEYLDNMDVYRATIIDFDFVFCAKREKANVIGDGIHDINYLIEEKNKNEGRGSGRNTPLFKIIIDEKIEKFLKEKRYTIYSIPKKNEKVYLQKDPFLYLGGDVIEVTEKVHPDNLKLFQDIARFFDVRVVALDFMCFNISQSWKEQKCAILELNSLPSIEIHHFPTSGKPKNVAKFLTEMVFKYYS